MDSKLFRIAGRWEKGETPTEREMDTVYAEFPQILDRMASLMNGLANIADTDLSATELRHMAARYLGRDVMPEKSKGHQVVQTTECTVPVLDGKVLVNGVGSNETECQANIGLIDLDDDALNRVTFVPGAIQTVK